MSWHKQRPPAPDNQAKTAMTEEWAILHKPSGMASWIGESETTVRYEAGAEWVPARRYVTDWEEA